MVINTCAAASSLTAEVQDGALEPAPNIASVEDDVAVPVQNACAVRRFLPLQPEHVPPIVTLFRRVVPVSVSPLTVGEVASITSPDPVVPAICDAAMWPLLSPSGIPAHAPGVPAVTLTQAATPLALAAEFCSISPCAHARVVGAAGDFVGSCIS